MKKFIIWTIVAVCFVGGGFFVFKKMTTKQEEPLEIAEAYVGTIEEVVSATGTIKSAQDADLSFKVSGELTALNVDAGDYIEAGQELASLNATDLDASAMEAEAAVKVAEAQLDEVKAGATQDEITAQEVAVENARANLLKTEESAEKAIQSAQAQVDSQQIVVNNKKQALDDANASAKNSLDAAYESGLDAAKNKYLVISDTVDVVNDMFDDYDLMAILGNLDMQAKIEAIKAKDSLNEVFSTLKSFIDQANLTEESGDIDQALFKTEEVLNSADESLETIYDALLKTQHMANITEAELDAYKTSISTERTSIKTAITSVISAQQTIASTKISNNVSMNTAQQALDSAVALLAQYTAALDATEASQDVQITSAEGALKSAEEQLKLKRAETKTETVAIYEAKVKQAKAAFASVLKKYSDRTITSPANGIVADTFKQEGENAVVGEKIISMIIRDGMEIEVDVPESDIIKVSTENSCEITLDAFPSDEILSGFVVSVYPAENMIEGVVYYKVKILLNGQDERIKPGMTANVDIITQRKENIVIIPARFIEKINGKQVVKVVSSEESINEREVERGIRDIRGNIEIISGLEAGEKVIEY